MRFRVIQVEANTLPDGWPVPSVLSWAGSWLTVIDIGRRWRSDDGLHLLVRVLDGRVFELHTNGSLWRAAVVSEPPGSV